VLINEIIGSGDVLEGLAEIETPYRVVSIFNPGAWGAELPPIPYKLFTP